MAMMLPRYQQRVGDTNIPGARLNVPTSSPGTEAIVQAGVRVASEVERIRAADDEAVVSSLRNELVRARLEHLEGDNGILRQSGENALAKSGEIAKSYRDTVSAIANQARGSRQKREIAKVIPDEQLSFDTTMNRHVYAETKKYRIGQHEAVMSSAAEDAALHGRWGDIAVVYQAQQRGLEALEKIADEEGLGKDSPQRLEARRKYTSEFMKNSIPSMVEAGKYGTRVSKKLLEDFGEAMDQNDRAKLLDMVQKSEFQIDVEDAAASLIASHNGDYEQALGAKMPFPEEEKNAAVVAQILKTGRAKRAAEGDQWKNTIRDTKFVFKDQKKTFDQVLKESPATFANAPEWVLDALRDASKREQDARAGGGGRSQAARIDREIATGFRYRLSIEQQMREDIDDPNSIYANMSIAGRNTLVGYQKELIRKVGRQDQQAGVSMSVAVQYARAEAQKAFNNVEDRRDFVAAMTQEILNKTSTEREMSMDEVRALTNQKVVESKSSGFLSRWMRSLGIYDAAADYPVYTPTPPTSATGKTLPPLKGNEPPTVSEVPVGTVLPSEKVIAPSGKPYAPGGFLMKTDTGWKVVDKP